VIPLLRSMRSETQQSTTVERKEKALSHKLILGTVPDPENCDILTVSGTACIYYSRYQAISK